MTITHTLPHLDNTPSDLPMHPMLKRVVAYHQIDEKRWIAVLELHNEDHPYSTHLVYDNGECLSGTYHKDVVAAHETAFQRWDDYIEQGL